MNRFLLFSFLFALLIWINPARTQDFDADFRQAMKYCNSGKYAEAGALFEKWLPAKREELGCNDTSVYLNLVAWAGISYLNAGNYGKAEPLMKETMRIIKENIGGDDPEYAEALNNLAGLYYEMGRYQQTETLYKEALQIDKEKLGEDHPSYALHLNNLAALYYQTGHFEQAEHFYKEALSINKEKLGQDHPNYAAALSNLAQLYQELGCYEKAEPLMKEALRKFKERLGQDHSYYTKCLNNLAQLYQDMGRYGQAEPLMEEALRISKEKLGGEHPSYALRLNNMAQLYKDMGRYEQAEPLMKEALRIDKEKQGEDHPSYARDLNNMALLYKTMGRYEQAEPLMKEALRIDKEKLGEDHPSYARELNNLALLYQAMGRYEQAEPLMTDVLRIDKEKLGERHPDYALHLNNMARLYLAMGRYKQAEPLLKKAFGIYQYQLKSNTGFLSEAELEKFLDTFLYNLDIYQSFNISDPVKDSPGNTGAFAFDIELNRKGILLQASQQLRTRILESGDTSMENIFNRLLSLRCQIEKLNSLDPLKRQDDPVKIQEQANDLEKDLILKSQDYRQGKEEVSVTWKDVQHQLKSGEAIVEFLSFRFYDKRRTDSIYYCALVLRPEYIAPKLVFLFEERALSRLLNATGLNSDRLYASNRGMNVLGASNDLSRQSGLYQLLLLPIEGLLKGVKTIYWVPSGLLHRISLPAIAVDAKKRLTDRFNLVCLSTSKKLVTRNREERLFTSNKNTIALYGGIDYEWNTIQPQLQQGDGGGLSAMRSIWLPEDRTQTGTFSYLPGTLEEVNSVDELCHKHHVNDQLFIAEQATEAQFKSLSGKNSPAIIHLATHGFYMNDTATGSVNYHIMAADERKYVYAKDPLLRSGLALAGANCAWSGLEIPEGMENGILQAKEVSNMDLRNTKLVVLSACETALGDVKGSEGVFGLQRAFKMAGAEYLLMSLWPVSDEATRMLMTLFYENCFNGQPIRTAFKNAQNKLRHLKKEYEDPFYWAAWVLVE